MLFDRYDRIVPYYATMWPLLVPGYVPILNGMRDIAQALPTKARSILDIGCGPGSATVAVAPACDPRAKVDLVDGSPKMMQEAQRLLGANIRRATVGNFAMSRIADEVFGDEEYDLVLSSFALHHLDDSQKIEIIDRISLGLRQGGALLIADETALERPGGFEVVERIRGRIIHEHMQAGRINRTFWELESNLPVDFRLPFLPARLDDMRIWMTRSGLQVTCPMKIFGSALLLGIKA